MDFVTGLQPSKDWRGIKYDSILVIVDRLTKIVHYEAVQKTLTAGGLAEMILNAIIRYHAIPDSIVSDRGSLFTSQSWFVALLFHEPQASTQHSLPSPDRRAN